MTPREEKRRQGYLAHQRKRALEMYLAKQQMREQTGGSPKWNHAVATGDDALIWLDVIGPDEEEQPAD